MLGCKWGERYSDTPGNRRSLVQTPTCEKHPLGRGHTSIAPGLGVVAHFGPPFYNDKKKTRLNQKVGRIGMQILLFVINITYFSKKE